MRGISVASVSVSLRLPTTTAGCSGEGVAVVGDGKANTEPDGAAGAAGLAKGG